VLFQQKQGIFAQGDTADAVFYIQTGKEATIGILGGRRLFVQF
jgi:hypothetical protein